MSHPHPGETQLSLFLYPYLLAGINCVHVSVFMCFLSVVQHSGQKMAGTKQLGKGEENGDPLSEDGHVHPISTPVLSSLYFIVSNLLSGIWKMSQLQVVISTPTSSYNSK